MAYLYCILGILDLMLSSILGILAGKLEGLDVDDDSLERKHVDRKLVAFIHVVQTPRRLGLPSIMSCDRSLHSLSLSSIVHASVLVHHDVQVFLVQSYLCLSTPLNLVFLDSHTPSRDFEQTATHLRAFLASAASSCGT